MQEIWVGSLGWEDPLEKGMATHSGTLAWKIPWMEKPGGLQFMRSQELDTTEQPHFTSLQCSAQPLITLHFSIYLCLFLKMLFKFYF